MPETDALQKAQLCYVGENCRAWFTTAPLDQQWGDDWNDAPYEHNAGSPYAWYPGRDEARWEIVTLLFDSPVSLMTPAEACAAPNSPYSVEQINRGGVPWLTDQRGHNLYPGMTVTEFREAIRDLGGSTTSPRIVGGNT